MGFCPNILEHIIYLWNDRISLCNIIPFVKYMFDIQYSVDMIIKHLLSIIQICVKFEQERFGRKLMMPPLDLIIFMKCGVYAANNATYTI